MTTRLRQERVRSGHTMRFIARQADISAQHLCDMEHGRRSPSLTVAKRIATALDVDHWDLWEVDMENPRLRAREPQS